MRNHAKFWMAAAIACAFIGPPATALAGPAPASTAATDLVRYREQVAAAMACLDRYMDGFNTRDVKLFESSLNFPTVRLAASKLVILAPGETFKEGYDTQKVTPGWDHTAWTLREVVDAGPDKVHIRTRLTRYRKDGSEVMSFYSLYIVTLQEGHWGIKVRSSYAPA